MIFHGYVSLPEGISCQQNMEIFNLSHELLIITNCLKNYGPTMVNDGFLVLHFQKLRLQSVYVVH
jgi:hypothetical protein